MPLVFTAEQVERPVLADRGALRRDLLEHLLAVRPKLFRIYPLPYLRWVVDDTITLAAPFGLQSVPAQRMFLQLRFDIAPGFYKEPAIADVLADQALEPMARWEKLGTEEFGDAWLQATARDGSDEWRARFWTEAA
jgi:hypothetical protein